MTTMHFLSSWNVDIEMETFSNASQRIREFENIVTMEQIKNV